MEKQGILQLENVTKKRLQGTGYTLRIPKLTIYEGERLAILGPSGSGKSTVLDMLAFLLAPDEMGMFTFAPAEETNYDIKALWESCAKASPMQSQDELARIRLQHLGVILQSGALLPFLSVYDNMALAMQAKHNLEGQNSIEELANQLGILPLLNSMPHTLSLGERQRVAIGRTLAAKPSIILADEPTAALDPVYAQIIMELLTQAVDATKTTLIFVTHDENLAKKNATRLLHVTLEQQASCPNMSTDTQTDTQANMPIGTQTGTQAVVATLCEGAYV